jgi:hypothetical protein
VDKKMEQACGRGKGYEKGNQVYNNIYIMDGIIFINL